MALEVYFNMLINNTLGLQVARLYLHTFDEINFVRID